MYIRCTPKFLNLPPEIILHIFSFLDLPDLAALAQVDSSLIQLTSDPILHKYRIRIVNPSRLNYHLFRTDAQGRFLRPTIADLVHRGVMRGLNIERRWRMGTYFYSANSMIQYENGQRLAWSHACHVLSEQLLRHAGSSCRPLKKMRSVLLDKEYISPLVARSLLPIIRKLKWSLKCDQVAKLIKDGPCSVAGGRLGFAIWMGGHAQNMVKDGEKIRIVI